MGDGLHISSDQRLPNAAYNSVLCSLTSGNDWHLVSELKLAGAVPFLLSFSNVNLESLKFFGEICCNWKAVVFAPMGGAVERSVEALRLHTLCIAEY